MCYPYQFDSLAMSAFCGPSPVGELWSQTFIDDNYKFATADGPNPGDDAIHFSIWIAGDPETDRPAFQFQVYKGGMLVDNADLICFGPGERDWMVAPGTWTQSNPIPPWLPGDANLDAFRDGGDYTIWADNYGTTDAPPWSQGGWAVGNFNEDTMVDGGDYTIWADNYTGAVCGRGAGYADTTVPEPGAMTLTFLGMCAVMTIRRRAR